MNLQFIIYFKFLVMSFLLNQGKYIFDEKTSSNQSCDSLNRAVKNINTNSFEKKKIDIYNKVVEEEVRGLYNWGSSFLEGYYKNKILLIVVSKHEGDRENKTSTYITNGKDLIIKKERLIFSPPKWEENSKVHRKEEQFYYIHNNILTAWCKDGISVNDSAVDYTSKGGLLLKEFKNYKELLSRKTE